MRSSATAEDTAETSFAGMNETFLNIRGEEGVIDAVRRCWRSLFGARTIYYRGMNDFGQADMDIAVVVQRQVDSTRAGVMFTVNPATGERSELVIEGSFGLGEAVVSGSVSPDRYVVEKATLAIRRREVHHKDLVIEYADGGGTRQRNLSEEDALRAVLSDEEVLAVAALGRRIEEHYGSPQDTEWAFDPDGALWMLQSRPITTLHEQDHGDAAAAAAPDEPQAVLLRARRRAGQRRRRRARAEVAGRRRQPRRRRRARHAHDLPRLAAAAAPRGRRRDRLRRHDLPRRDRLARAGHPLRGRDRRGDRQAARRRDRDRRRHPRGCSRARGRPRRRAKPRPPRPRPPGQRVPPPHR